MKRHPAPSRSTPAARALLALMLAGGSLSLHAANQTWDGGGADANWSTVGNWNGDAASPGSTSVTTSTDIATFIADILNSWGLISSPILFDSTTQNIGGINFDLAAGNYYIGTTGGNALKLSNAGTIQILNTLTATNAVETINAPLAFQGTAYTFANNSANGIGTGAGTLNFGGSITGTTGATVLTLSGSNTNANTISGVIGNGTATTVAVTKTGTGTWVLTGANTYTGATTANSGTLKLDFSAAGSPTNNIISSSSALSLGGGTLQVVGSTSSGTVQTFASTNFNAGTSIISAAPASGSNLPVLNLGALTFQQGAAVRFDGPATINGSGNVAATATITTTSVGGGSNGLIRGTLFTGTNPAAAAYATVGLYDWASTSLADGTAGTSPYTIIGGSQVTGFYKTTYSAGGNFDMQVNQTATSSGFSDTVRYNTPTATTFTGNGNTVIGGFLITPNMGAVNAILNGPNWQVIRNTGGSTDIQEGVIWQNNTTGYFNVNVPLVDGRDANDINRFIKAGDGTAVFTSTASTYRGQTYINGGNLVITANGGVGAQATAAAVNLNGGTLFGNATFTLDNAGANKRPITLLSSGGGLAASSGSTMTVSGVVSGATGTGALVIGIPASSANGNVAGLLPGSGSIANGQAVDTANTTAVFGTGTVALTGANTYTGGTIIKSGTLNINGLFALGGANYGGLTLDGGKLQYAAAFSGNGSGDVTGTGSTLNVGSLGGTIDVNGNAVTYANAIKSTGSGTLTIADSATTKGTLTLAGASTYTGNTTLSSGNLSVTNTTGSATGSGAVAINGGTLSGNGIISGPATLAGGTISPGATGTNLTFGSFTYTSGTLNFSLGAANASNTIFSTNLTFENAPTLTFNLSGVTGGETFTLFNSTNTITGASLFTGLAPIVIGRTTLTAQQTGNLLQLVSSGSAGNLQWNNAGATGDGSTWDITTNQNWRNTGTSSPDLFYDADNVTFNDSNNGHYAVTLNSTVSPGSLIVDNSAGDYTISGTGAIAGSTSLVKNGSSKLTLSTANTYTGGTTINAGTIASGTTNALTTAGALTVQGTGTFDLAGNNQTVASLSDGGVSTGTVTSSSGTPTLTVNNASANTFGGTVSGSLGLTKTSTGSLTLSGANTYTGLTTVSGGTLNATTDSALGNSSSTTGGLLINPAAGTVTVNFTSATPSIASLASSGAGTSSVVLGNGSTPATTTLTVGGGNASTTFAGVISDVNATTALGNLAMVGTGTLTLSGANTYHGTTTIASGATLNVANALALQNSSVDFSNGSLTFGPTTTATTFGSLQGSNASQNLALTNTAGTPAAVALTVGGNGATTTYAGILSGLGSLNKAGTGTMTLTGNNSYAGTTQVTGGTLDVTTGGVINGGAFSTSAATGGHLSVTGGSFTASGTSTVNQGGGQFLLSSGSATFGNLTGASSGSDNFLIRVDGGTFTATGVSLQRNQINNALPGAASTTSGFYVTNGTVDLGTLTIGTSNSSASARIDGGAVTATGAVNIGAHTSATGRYDVLQVNGGSFTSTDATNGISLVTTASSTNAELLLTGGVTTAELIQMGTSTTNAAGADSATLVLNGGTLYMGSGGIVQNASLNGGSFTSVVNLTNGTLGAKADWSSSLAMTVGTSPTIKAADAADVAHNISLSGVLSGTGGLTKTGAGILTLSGANTYAGTTTISAGTLTLGSSGSITGSSIVNNSTFDVSAVSGYAVGASQTLSGSGTVIGATLINGTLNPGNSPGVLTFNNDLTLAGTTNLEINSATRGTGYDGVNVGGTLTYGGTLNFLFGSAFIAGTENFQVFTGLDGSSLPLLNSPSFTSIILGGSYTASLTNNSGVWTGSVDGVDFTFTESTGTLAAIASAVPEPSTYAMLAGLTILGFAGLRRRRSV